MHEKKNKIRSLCILYCHGQALKREPRASLKSMTDRLEITPTGHIANVKIDDIHDGPSAVPEPINTPLQKQKPTNVNRSAGR